ncbi:peptidase C65 otubain protein (macronuclear) [Tetrahymena thermophila SB210]|uniref:ubiquitinyl hydrolase 1 n=1 Tax=Tetrahymena thermophila (strain SB210) TaxID=312017 RepID=Q22S76_TETTS|nr:peptidase C65 otubain protein [Tetrahymena thermophila SB210]EAR87896.2 peptidase C65 otubain protein [Tetrahymena thermophila SB210]|eukprot:XP_001008141.2 peptidase C65 otubain protein [Tetrahymena thermophila SB210]
MEQQYVDLFGYQLTHEQYQNITANDEEFQQFLQIISKQFRERGPLYFQKIRCELKSQLNSLQQLIKVDEYGQMKISNLQLQQGYSYVSKQYPFILKIRGDGNCFYRAVIIGIMVTIIQNNKNEFFRILIRQVQHTEKFVYQLKDEIMAISETDVGLILIKFFTQILIEKTINEKFSILQLFAEFNDFPEIDLSLNIFCRNVLNTYFEKSLKDPQYNQFIGDDMKTKIPFQLCVIGEEAEDVIIPLSANAFSYKIVIQNLYIDNNDKPYTDQIIYNPTSGEPADTIILCYSQGHYDLLLSQNQSQIFQNYPQIILNSKFVLKITKQQRILKDELIESELQQEENEKEKEKLQQQLFEQEQKALEISNKQKNIYQKIVDKCKRLIQKGKTKKEKEVEKASQKENDSLALNKKQSDKKKNLNFYQRLNSKKKSIESNTQQREKKGIQKCLECQNEFILNQGEEMLNSVYLCDNCYQLQSNQLIARDNNKKNQNGDGSRNCKICENEFDKDENFESEGICKQCIKMQILSNYKESECVSCKKEASFKIESTVYNNFKLGICQECVKENYFLFKEQEKKIETLKVYLKELSTYIVFKLSEEIQNYILTLKEKNVDIEIEKSQPNCSFCFQFGDQFLYETGNPEQLICLDCFKSQEYTKIQEGFQDEQIQKILWDIVNQLSIPSCFICFDPLNESENNIKIQDIIRNSSIQICTKCQKEGIFVFDQDDNISAFSSYLNHPLNIIPREEDKNHLKSALQNNLN